MIMNAVTTRPHENVEAHTLVHPRAALGSSSSYPRPIGPLELVNVVPSIPVQALLSSMDAPTSNFLKETFSLQTEDNISVWGGSSFLDDLKALPTSSGSSSSSSSTSSLNPPCTNMEPTSVLSHQRVVSPALEEEMHLFLSGMIPKQQPEQQVRVKRKRCHWSEKYQELLEFQKERGHCLVPNNWPLNVKLAQWVKRQRHQYKCRSDGKHSNLTEERIKALESLGFVWSVQEDTWEERFHELSFFRSQYGHCNVPKNCKKHPQLAVWVKYQRRHFKLYMSGERSSMTSERFVKLTNLGFQWDPRHRNRRMISRAA